jgi:hypothetical protein
MGDADHALRQDQQRVSGLDPVIGLGGVIGVTRGGKAVVAARQEGEAFAVGQCDVKSLK